MQSTPPLFSKLSILFMLQCLSFWLHPLALELAKDFFPSNVSGNIVYLILFGLDFVAIALTASLVCIPLVYFFKESPIPLAFMLSTTAAIPVLARIFELGFGVYHPAIYISALVNELLYVALSVFVAWLAARYLVRSHGLNDRRIPT